MGVVLVVALGLAATLALIAPTAEAMPAMSGKMRAPTPTYILAPEAVGTQEVAFLHRVEDHLLRSVAGISRLDYLSFAGVCAKKQGRPYRCPMLIDVTTFRDSQFSHTVCELGVSATRLSAWLASATCPAGWLNPGFRA